MAERVEGGCLCGGVRFAVHGRLRPVLFCHCEQCRRTSGHFVAASACEADGLILTADHTLSWYQSSDEAQRGFCNTCGASLFWRPTHGRYVAIMAGIFDDPNILTGGEHIFCEGISNYYNVEDGLPHHMGRGDMVGFDDA